MYNQSEGGLEIKSNPIPAGLEKWHNIRVTQLIKSLYTVFFK
jgi:hypothetical protein